MELGSSRYSRISKELSIIEVSAELSSLGLNEPTEIKVGYSRNYSDFAPVTGNKMAQANGIILDDEELLAKLIYLTSPLESSKNLTARVIVDGGDIDTSRNYYTEAFCSWDNETWYSKGGKDISIPIGEQNNYVDLEYCIFLNGDLYTKVVIYDSKGGTQLGEFVKSETDHIDVGMIENYDWYKFSESYDSDITVEGYISDIGGYAGEAAETVYAITKRSDEEIWRQYSLNNGEWSATGVTYATDPIENGGIMSFSKISPLETEEKYATMELGLPSIEDIRQMIENKKNELLDKFYVKIGINPAEINSEDVEMIIRGLAISVDDNVYFGLVQRISGAEPHDDNYYFMKAKAFGDAVFTAAYTTASVGSIIEAVRALESAGAAGAMALAAAPTGVGGAVLSGAAVTELAEAAAMSGISYISGKMAERSQGILKDSVEKLKETAGYIYREAKEKIENGLRDIGFTNKVEKTAEEINAWWRDKGYNDPYKLNTPVYEITLSEDTMFVRVYPEGGNMVGCVLSGV